MRRNEQFDSSICQSCRSGTDSHGEELWRHRSLLALALRLRSFNPSRARPGRLNRRRAFNCARFTFFWTAPRLICDCDLSSSGDWRARRHPWLKRLTSD